MIEAARREFKRSANCHHILSRADQFADPLPVATQLSLLADSGHVIAGIADGAQYAAVFVR
jgi:hypothetical protein